MVPQGKNRGSERTETNELGRHSGKITGGAVCLQLSAATQRVRQPWQADDKAALCPG